MRNFDEKPRIPILSDLKSFLSIGASGARDIASGNSGLAIPFQLILLGFFLPIILTISILEFLVGFFANRDK